MVARMKKLFAPFVLFLFYFSSHAAVSSKPWQGARPAHRFSVGTLAGIGITGAFGGPTLLANAGFVIMPEGLVPDMNNQLLIEIEAGPQFLPGSVLMPFSGHVRWDFHYDDFWTFYALGGIGGVIKDSSYASQWELFPRFGVGAFWHFFVNFSFRAELSHEFVGLGVAFRI